ncbi:MULTISPECIES: DUF5960 family protein [Streptococcus]|jgi:hypothetical protein|uniref:Uncharacterized protein n=1 Tax=Streptococcus oralis subsp. oralis TaxID=1891914 RepID=A0A7H9FD77_STROR|nr:MULTISPECIES: DUF5960 family protein [Streptococcus]EIC78559.1 hypothetical protein HMPREF1113_0604 [Streptococcus oralis SK10]ETD06319.1 hypothetical protein HMPREF1196_02113 [Streptococcus sanguinis CC94A]KZX08988.1 hypothetical protein A4221_08895 [Streptococcus oralis]MBZ2093514.1 hypothetical protein [Streptococcus oralis]MBZ2096541.1 hypothetical protein [Streptococcus oralis]
MSRKELYENKLQMDYFSEDYIRFEEDFQKYSAMSVPLTFLIDDILRTMAMNQKNYFKLNKENAKDGRDHYFYFEIGISKESGPIRRYHYSGLNN